MRQRRLILPWWTLAVASIVYVPLGALLLFIGAVFAWSHIDSVPVTLDNDTDRRVTISGCGDWADLGAHQETGRRVSRAADLCTLTDPEHVSSIRCWILPSPLTPGTVLRVSAATRAACRP